jgi:catechol 2,3-dioxygenase-like lactoylglutathione lyase family enzyme
MSIDNALAGLAVRDLDSAIAWYGRLLGREPDSRPMPELAEWKFARGGWLQVFQVPERAGGGSCTLAVSDIGEITRHVASLGIDTRDQAAGEQVKTLMITDPDGNHIAFAQTIDPTMAR